MAAGNIYIFAFLTALVAVNLIFADDSSLEDNAFDVNEADVGEEAERDARSTGEAQERTFFTLIGVSTSCNYTQSPGATCSGCRRALRCFSNNQGIVRVCTGLLPYCNAGRCSFIPGSACNSG